MQKIDVSKTAENTVLVAAAVLYFTALILFSFWFTQS